MPHRMSFFCSSVRNSAPAVSLFHAKVGPLQGVALPSYIAWPDGRFLIDTVIEETPSPLRIILNWNGRESR